MADYVIKSGEVNSEQSEAGAARLEIRGRASGLVSWLLAQQEISPTVRFLVTDARIVFEEGSLSGNLRFDVPLEHVCAIFSGFVKPWKQALILGTIEGQAIDENAASSVCALVQQQLIDARRSSAETVYTTPPSLMNRLEEKEA